MYARIFNESYLNTTYSGINLKSRLFSLQIKENKNFSLFTYLNTDKTFSF